MTSLSKVIREETDQQEHERLKAQREQIARFYGHAPKAAVVRVPEADARRVSA